MRILTVIVLTFPLLLCSSSGQTIEIIDHRFTLAVSDSICLIHDAQNEDTLQVRQDWLIDPEAEEFNEQAFVSSFEFEDSVTAFNIGGGLTGLHISSFAAQKSGSAQSASGRDVFLAANLEHRKIVGRLAGLDITKSRGRYLGCMSALATHFILADVNNDGFLDIGCIEERINCPPDKFDKNNSSDVPYPNFSQQPVVWNIFDGQGWSVDSTFSGLPEKYTELPLIGIIKTTVDFVGYMRFKTLSPEDWPHAGRIYFHPAYREKLAKGIRK